MEKTNRIRALREERHMTQVRLSIELEVSQETISSYENGKHYPSVPQLIKLSNILHASCDYILNLSDNRYNLASDSFDTSTTALLVKWKKLNPHQKDIVHAYIDGMMVPNPF